MNPRILIFFFPNLVLRLSFFFSHYFSKMSTNLGAPCQIILTAVGGIFRIPPLISRTTRCHRDEGIPAHSTSFLGIDVLSDPKNDKNHERLCTSFAAFADAKPKSALNMSASREQRGNGQLAAVA